MPPKSATKSPKPAVVSPPAGGNAGRSDERSMSQEAELEQRVAAAVNEHLARLQLGQQVPAAALQPAAVGHIAVKLADFWVSDPDVWFLQTEAEFGRARITVSRTKYQYVLPRLPEAVAVSMRSLLQRIDDTTQDAYEQLKAGLLHKYGKSKWQRGFAIIDHPDIGDRRPSQLMSDMLALLPAENVPDTLFLCHFLRRLPVSMRDHLAAADCNTAEEMATYADRLWDARAGQPISHVSPQDASIDAVDSRSFSPGGARRTPGGQNAQRGKRGRGGHNSGGGQPRSSTPGPLCRLHKKWGARAYNCEKPCSWSGN